MLVVTSFEALPDFAYYIISQSGAFPTHFFVNHLILPFDGAI
tara:strand:- start:3859 stop:3984 length:126 start_codon:yes stop_codon:yes gene_type:complete